MINGYENIKILSEKIKEIRIEIKSMKTFLKKSN
jgi:hypothetical protein